jgi:poly-beta-1,6-N-acetyl-D-glucosamine synthase
VILLLSILLGFFYLIIISSFFYGWLKIPVYAPGATSVSIKISVVVAVRNESVHIENLINALSCQDYPTELLEIIFVDDHSIDSTYEIISKNIHQFAHFRVLRLDENIAGKKYALRKGIWASTGEVIVTTDGDCLVGTKWISVIASYFSKYHPKLLIAPVLLTNERTLYHQLQSLEFLSLSASVAGSSEIKRPVMCNGANLAFSKEAYDNLVKDDFWQYSSGDDVMLMLSVKRQNRDEIKYLKSLEAIVYTYPCNTPGDFLQQRARWTSKSKGYRDFDVITTALVVLLISFFLVFTLIGSFYSKTFLTSFIILFLAKSVIDFVFLRSFASFFGKRGLMLYFIPVQFIYPFYIGFTAIYGLTAGFRWKGRKINT